MLIQKDPQSALNAPVAHILTQVTHLHLRNARNVQRVHTVLAQAHPVVISALLAITLTKKAL